MHSLAFPLGLLWVLPALIVFGVGGGLVLRYLRLGGRSAADANAAIPSAAGERGGLEPAIFRLALQRGGRLTVSDVVIATNLTPQEAEETLNAMTDGVRVGMEVTDNGLVVYEFTELMQRSQARRITP